MEVEPESLESERRGRIELMLELCEQNEVFLQPAIRNVQASIASD